MTVVDFVLQCAGVVASALIVLRAEPVLNRMSRHTPIMIRAAFHLLTLGSAAEILYILLGTVPSATTVILSAGIACLLVCERRLRVLCPPQRSRA